MRYIGYLWRSAKAEYWAFLPTRARFIFRFGPDAGSTSAPPRQRHPSPTRGRMLLALPTIAALLWSLLGGVSGLEKPQVVSAASDPVIAAAGDIACDPAESSFNGGSGTSTKCREKYTSDLLVNGGFAAILPLGDEQYYCGGYQAFVQSYDPSWGRVRDLSHPVVGNHEYLTSGGTDCSTIRDAAGYFDYFGSAAGTAGQGYYSYDIGSWHLIALNSNCSNVGGCGSTSAQYKWLQSDLAAHPNRCTLAYWHIPLFSSGGRAASNSKPFWNLLYAAHADVVLNGHDHIYERFAPQDPSGNLDAAYGIREFIVGTGGENHTGISAVAANSELYNASTYGILKLTLHSSSYDWKFVPETGKTFTDSGSGTCHSSPATATPTSTPTSTGGQSMTFTPQADAYVNASNPTTNYGTLTTLRTDASPDVHSYLRFSVSGLGGQPISRARLQVYANSAGSLGISGLSVADNTWDERTITYNTAPPLGSTLATSGAFSSGTWVTLDVTNYVKAEGTYSFGMTTSSSTAISFQSKEAGTNRPQVIIDLGTSSSTATPTPTSVNTPTPTSANTPTPTPTSANTATPTPTPTTTSGQSVTFVPDADTYVHSGFPTTNYGTSTQLRADGSPDVHSYARFTVQGLAGASISRALLRFYMNSGSTSGLRAQAVADNTWDEKTVAYNTAPPLGATIYTSGALTTGTWVTLDVTSYVTAEGTYSFGITTPGSTAVSFASREAGPNAPQLIVDLGP